jgi:TolA-binding protein
MSKNPFRGQADMKKLLFAIGISLVVGFAAASWMETALVSSGTLEAGFPEPNISSFDAAAPVEERIRALEQAVIQEQQARQWLEEEILVLRDEIERRDAQTTAAEEQNVVAREERIESFRSRRSGTVSTQDQLDRLVAAGFPPDQAQWIVDREAELQMERLQARYEVMQARGEQGFFGRGSSQDSALRAELGDTDYERYLTANGRSTSVGIGNVLPNSPAQAGGIQPGDEIVRYDGERVFSMMDVAGRIMESEAAGNVVVDIVRDGLPMQLVLPRGPLGVTGD